MADFLSRFWRAERGTTAIEYALIAGGIALAIVGAVAALGGGVSANFSNIQAGVR